MLTTFALINENEVQSEKICYTSSIASNLYAALLSEARTWVFSPRNDGFCEIWFGK